MRSEKPVVFYTVDKQQINLQSFHLLAYSAFFIYSCSSGKFASYVQLTKQISEQLYKLEKTMANQSSPQTIATTNTVNTTLLLLHRTTCVSQLHSYELKASAAAKFYSPLASSAIILKKKTRVLLNAVSYTVTSQAAFRPPCKSAYVKNQDQDILTKNIKQVTRLTFGDRVESAASLLVGSPWRRLTVSVPNMPSLLTLSTGFGFDCITSTALSDARTST